MTNGPAVKSMTAFVEDHASHGLTLCQGHQGQPISVVANYGLKTYQQPCWEFFRLHSIYDVSTQPSLPHSLT